MIKLAHKVAALRGTEVQKPNWNSYGADAISDATIAAAERVAEILDGERIKGRRLTTVCPHANGAIVLSDNDESIWIEISVDSTEGVE